MKKYSITWIDFDTREFKGSKTIEIQENENIYTYLQDDFYQNIIVVSCSKL